ncbi:ABC transporter ATP-binding protein [Lujinxingia litoralis]|uniref:ABC transporter ATP-binding protein n=1 Tax=Lujinxingia litoralis TaxID=2211119 RepID=UPI0018F5F136|nr:ABC transporter ATP-binding protein [Lujinxingia litoralis]
MTSKGALEAVVELKGLTKRYGELKAVDDVSLAIEPGEIFALLGPNGAGKTTMIGCVTGMITGFEGRAAVAGLDVVENYRVTRRMVGLVPQELNWDAFFTVRQVLEFQAGYFGVKPTRGEIDALLDQFSLLEKADANTRWLSGGMKRRLMICKALMHDPVVLFLDEPTAGVDVELRDELWGYVEALRERGTTIVLTTHYLEEAEKLADRVGIINQGRLLRVDDREALLEAFGRRHVSVTLSEIPSPQVLEALGPHQVEVEGRTLTLSYGQTEGDEGGEVDFFLRAIVGAGARVESVEGGRSSLETIFREVLHGDLAQKEAMR